MNLTGQAIYQKGQDTPKPKRYTGLRAQKPMRQVSKKRADYRKSDAGQAGMEHMGKVKQLPCVICLSPPPNDAHHCFHGRYGTRKASDFDVIPLCKLCHQDGPDAIHNAKRTWAEKNGFDYEYLPTVRDMLAGEWSR